jgi:hypothetical protein
MKRSSLTFLLVLATIVTFARVVNHEFVGWDDGDTIVQNPRLRPPRIEGVAYYWTHPAAGLYAPLTYTVWSTLAVLAEARTPAGDFELNPWVFHAASLMLHVLSAVVVLDLLRRLVGQDLPALVGAMLFALHPMQVESVAWASGLKDVLCGLLALVAIQQYVIFAQKQRRLHYMVALATLLLALLSKSTAMVVPLTIVVIDVWILGTPIRKSLRRVLPMVIVTIPFALIAWQVQKSYVSTLTPLWTRPLIAADSLGFYLCKLLVPWPLTVVYGRTPGTVVGSGAIYYMWILPALVCVALIVFRKRVPALVAAALVFVSGLLPVLGLTNFMMQTHSTVADHYMYLPMLGAALAAAWAVAQFERARIYATCGAALMACASLSFLQLGYWHDGVALFGHAVAVRPGNEDARIDLGHALAQANRLDEAIPHFQRAVQINPTSRASRELLTQALVFSGRYEEAIPHAEASLQLARADNGSDTAQIEFLLGRALSQLGRYDEAATHLAEATRQQPADKRLAAELESVRNRKMPSGTTRP